METQYFKNYSPSLGRDMECKVYGHAGKPVLFIPCQDGRFFDFEDVHMTDTWSAWIDSGKAMVFSIDTMDKETWSNKDGDPAWRAQRHEQWINYITREMVPFIREMVNERNGWDGYPGILVFGCSMGANHAVNLYFRFPDLFDGMLALSGVYDTDRFFGGYMDETLYKNTPERYLADMPADHPYIARYNQNQGIICVGQGDWEEPDTSRRLDSIFREKGIEAWVDFWGYDVAHDWPWWYKQVPYFLNFLLGEP